MKKDLTKIVSYYDIVRFEKQLNTIADKGYYLLETKWTRVTYRRKSNIDTPVRYAVRKVEPSQRDLFISHLPEGWSVAKIADKRVLVLVSNQINPEPISVKSPFYQLKPKEYMLKFSAFVLLLLVVFAFVLGYGYLFYNLHADEMELLAAKGNAEFNYLKSDLYVYMLISSIASFFWCAYIFVFDAFYMKNTVYNEDKFLDFLYKTRGIASYAVDVIIIAVIFALKLYEILVFS